MDAFLKGTITIQEACQILGKSDKQVRRYITHGTRDGRKLKAQLIGKQYFIKLTDLEEFASQPVQNMDTMTRRIEKLEQRLAQLEERLAVMDTLPGTTLEAPQPPQAIIAPTPQTERPTRPSVPYRATGKKSTSTREELPEDLVAWSTFVEHHGLRPDLIDKLDYVLHGEWRQGRARIFHALDYAGQDMFVKAFREHKNFHVCNVEDCVCHRLE